MVRRSRDEVAVFRVFESKNRLFSKKRGHEQQGAGQEEDIGKERIGGKGW
jgi:hypothetical protein